MTSGCELVLRTCKADGTSLDGFPWPETGPVRCPDWSPEPTCGGGLHGLLWGEGDGSLLDWSPDAKWQVVGVTRDDIVDLGGIVKFSHGDVIHTGDQQSATDYIWNNGGRGKAIVGLTATAGYGGTATAGRRGILILRYYDYTQERPRLAVAHVGENGIKPNTPYRLVDGGFVEAQAA